MHVRRFLNASNLMERIDCISGSHIARPIVMLTLADCVPKQHASAVQRPDRLFGGLNGRAMDTFESFAGEEDAVLDN